MSDGIIGSLITGGLSLIAVIFTNVSANKKIVNDIKSEVKTNQAVTDDTYGRVTSAQDMGYTKNTGTVTSVGITAGSGVSVSGSPITKNGSITVGHTNSVSAQTTQAVYPIKIDGNGHISSYGSAVTILKKIYNYFNRRCK